MKYDIILVVWNDALSFDGEEFRKETFSLCPTVQVGLLTKEDNGILQLCYGFSTDVVSPECDYINIPSSLITYRKKLGVFDFDTRSVL
ncbi:MAG: hypothetical protein BV457_08995 [Thermoplasmata archaeon M9B1D]|nr:MAG: hypothetical protein BV457_08995 [Thermoplasmata archaeon M9B1D]